MAAFALKLSDELARSSSQCAKARGLSRAEYIRKAIELLNRQTEREIGARRIADASHRVRAESMRVNAEFAAIEADPVDA